MFVRVVIGQLNRMLKIALGHQARVGKDTFAAAVKSLTCVSSFPNVVTYAFSDSLYEIAGIIQEFAGVRREKDPELLQNLGTFCRQHYGDDFWINKCNEKIQKSNGVILVTDMRYANEMTYLKNNGFITVKITRKDRVIDRDPGHKSEIDLLDAEFDYTLTNDGTEEEFREKAIKFVDSLLQKRPTGSIDI